MIGGLTEVKASVILVSRPLKAESKITRAAVTTAMAEMQIHVMR